MTQTLYTVCEARKTLREETLTGRYLSQGRGSCPVSLIKPSMAQNVMLDVQNNFVLESFFIMNKKENECTKICLIRFRNVYKRIGGSPTVSTLSPTVGTGTILSGSRHPLDMHRVQSDVRGAAADAMSFASSFCFNFVTLRQAIRFQLIPLQ